MDPASHQLTHADSQWSEESPPDPIEQESLSLAVAKAIAEAQGISPTDPSFRLYDSVNPEAIDALFRHRQDDAGDAWELSFESGSHTVTVRSDGSVLLDVE